MNVCLVFVRGRMDARVDLCAVYLCVDTGEQTLQPRGLCGLYDSGRPCLGGVKRTRRKLAQRGRSNILPTLFFLLPLAHDLFQCRKMDRSRKAGDKGRLLK